MTSLQHQLKKLKKAPTGALAVERDYSSLLFDRKEAAAHDRDDFYKIGLAGLKGMKWLDNDFDTYEPELFEKKMLNFNRAMLSQEEAEEFDQRIEAIILRLCPYFHHQSCRQVLEWLIHKYQVHSYNAQTLFLAFLPYHNQNSFGRLLRILRFNSPGMDWLAEFQKSGAPLPLNVLSRACQSGKSYWMVSALSSFVQKMLTILESPYVDAKLHHYFTFLVSLFGSLLENQVGKPDEQFISRLVVFLGSALKSKLNSYKCAGTMLFCSLAVNVPISEQTANSLLELLLFKVRAPLCQLVLEATNVVCERLAISSLPKKQIMWLVYRSPELGLADLIREMMGSYNMTAFLVPFWKILMEELATGEKEDWREHFTDLLITSLDLEQMDDAQARAVFGLLLDWVENAVDSGFEKQTKVLPKKLRTHVRAMAIRFPVAFNGMRTSRRLENIQRLMEECLIQSHEVEPLESMDSGKGSKKKRKKQRQESREEPEREEGHSSRKLRLESPD